jgi:hypothetical protein
VDISDPKSIILKSSRVADNCVVHFTNGLAFVIGLSSLELISMKILFSERSKVQCDTPIINQFCPS